MSSINKLCRLCTKKCNILIPIYQEDTDKIKFVDKLNNLFTDLNLLDDNLPSLICPNCILQLKQAYDFKKQYINSQIFWKNYFVNPNITFENVILKEERETNEDSADKTKFENSVVENTDCHDQNSEDHDCIKQENTPIGSPVYNEQDSSVKNDDTSSKSSNDQDEPLPVICELNEENKGLLKTRMRRNRKPRQYLGESDIEDEPPLIEKPEKKRRGKKPGSNPKIDKSTYILDRKQNFYFCKLCNRRLATPFSLRTHMLRHTGVKSFMCDYCGKKLFTLTALKSHMLGHSDVTPFPCKICNKSFKDRGRLNTHMKFHSDNRPHVCDICGKKFVQVCALKTHLLVHSDEKKFPCSVCPKSFKSQASLKVHMDRHKDRTFDCNTCNRTFLTYAGFYNHTKTHGEKKFKCDLCNKAFFMKHALGRHMESHSTNRPYSCNNCDKKFASKDVLRCHQTVHTGEKRFSCHVCKKSFAQSGTLSVHMRLHTGIRPYKCSNCDKAFIKSHHLDNHLKKHHQS